MNKLSMTMQSIACVVLQNIFLATVVTLFFQTRERMCLDSLSLSVDALLFLLSKNNALLLLLAYKNACNFFNFKHTT